MNGTLPLFEQCSGGPADNGPADNGSIDGGSADNRPIKGSPDKRRAPRARSGTQASAEERHLRAAWRLSRGMWRYPDHSPQQTRAGRAICHHLRALLAEPQDSTPR